MKFFARWHMDTASQCEQSGDLAGAIAAYEKAIRSSPRWSVPWYNLGLLYKYQHEWRESYRCNAEAARLAPADEAAWWNLGIAATALSDWAEARRAWKACGIPVPDGDGPVDYPIGSTPIRLNPHDDGEVVWTERIDPARAIIRSIPTPDSGHRHGDLLLHDGAPNGYRMSGDREVAVFDELQLLQPSLLGTFEAIVEVADIHDLVALEETFTNAGFAAEDWSMSLQALCRKCSEGRPHEHEHQHAAEPRIEGEHRFAFAAPDAGVVRQLLESWEAGSGPRRAGDVVMLLAPLSVH